MTTRTGQPMERPMLQPINDIVLIDAARSLRTEDDSNPEYDRALVELTCRTLGFGEESQSLMARLILGDRPKTPPATVNGDAAAE